MRNAALPAVSLTSFGGEPATARLTSSIWSERKSSRRRSSNLVVDGIGLNRCSVKPRQIGPDERHLARPADRLVGTENGADEMDAAVLLAQRLVVSGILVDEIGGAA